MKPWGREYAPALTSPSPPSNPSPLNTWNAPPPGSIPTEQRLPTHFSPPRHVRVMRDAISDQMKHITYDTRLDFLLDEQSHPDYENLIDHVIKARVKNDFPHEPLMELAKTLYLRANCEELRVPAGGVTMSAVTDANRQARTNCEQAAQDVFFLGLLVNFTTGEQLWAMNAALEPLPARFYAYEKQMRDSFAPTVWPSHLDPYDHEYRLNHFLGEPRVVQRTAQARQPAPVFDLAKALVAHWQPPHDRGFLKFLVVQQPFSAMVDHLTDPIRMEFAHPLLTGILDTAVYCLQLSRQVATPLEQTDLVEVSQRLAYLSLFLGIAIAHPSSDLLPSRLPAGLEPTRARLAFIWNTVVPDEAKPFQQMVLERYCPAST